MNRPVFDASLFGQKIKRLRKAKGLSQEELAAAINKTVDTVSNIERGVSMPRLESVCDLATVLGVPVYELLYMQDMPAADKERLALIDGIMAALRGQPASVLQLAFALVAHLVAARQEVSARFRK